jgi:hypothetical protein
MSTNQIHIELSNDLPSAQISFSSIEVLQVCFTFSHIGREICLDNL